MYAYYSLASFILLLSSPLEWPRKQQFIWQQRYQIQGNTNSHCLPEHHASCATM